MPSPTRRGSRVPAATLAAILFILAYIAVAITLPDFLPRQHWAVEAAYWCVAGVLWVFPVWGLMLWAAQGGERGR